MMATTLNNQSQDLLAKLLPPNTDAKILSHYICLLAESEQRLRQELNDLRRISTISKPTGNVVESVSIDSAVPSKNDEPRLANKPTPTKITLQKNIIKQILPKKHPNSIAEVNYKIGLRHIEAGTKEDISQALDCFLAADAYGHAEASVTLAELFYYGKLVDKDLEKSMFYYQNAAATGHAHALYSVAYMTYHGEGELMDKDEAVKLFRMAASKGSTDAKEMLDWLRC